MAIKFVAAKLGGQYLKHITEYKYLLPSIGSTPQGWQPAYLSRSEQLHNPLVSQPAGEHLSCLASMVCLGQRGQTQELGGAKYRDEV